MAVCWLLETSGDGDYRGVAGSQATELYGVILDYEREDASTIVERQARALGVPHPIWKALLSESYSVRRTDNPHYCEVLVTFRHPLRTELNQWVITIDYGNSTERIYADRTGELIGPYAYEPVADDDPRAASAAYYARVGDKNVKLWADITSPSQRSRVGTDVYKGATTVRLSRVLPKLSYAMIRGLDEYKNPRPTCNEREFMCWHSHELLFVDAHLEEQEAPLLEGVKPDKAYQYPCDLIFLVNLDGWRYQKLRHTFKDDDGNESLVYSGDPVEGGAPVEDNFDIYEERNFDTLIALLDGKGGRIG